MDAIAFASDRSVFYEPVDRAAEPIEVHLPSSWLFARSGDWLGVWPPDVPQRTNGWKMHLSLDERTLHESLPLVVEICVAARTPFKFVSDRLDLRIRNAKNADRTGSGKAVTIYPASDAVLERLARDLHRALRVHSGPWILTDVRFDDGPVHFRYGAFLPASVEHEDGPVPARPDASGVLVPDLRVPRFVDPVDVPRPPAVAEAIRRYFEPPVSNPLDTYKAIEPLHFSNAGGVYAAVRSDGSRVVLKEARAGAGLDARGRDAVARLHVEHRNLVTLTGLRFAPVPLGMFQVLEHTFIEMEHIEGTTLSERTVSRCPVLMPDAVDDDWIAYAESVERVVVGLEQAIEEIHRRGIVVGDMHPSNVLVRADDSIVLIDLEDDRAPGDREAPAFNALGYRGPIGGDARDADWYAFSRVIGSLFDPSFARELLAPDHWQTTRALVRAHATARTTRALQRAEARTVPGRRAFAAPPGASVALSASTTSTVHDLGRGIEAARRAVPNHYPGDPRGFVGSARFSCSFGLSGVLLAQLRLGEIPTAADLDILEGAASAIEEVGLFDGLAGVAHVLHLAGRLESARIHVDELVERASGVRDCSFASGIVGVACAIAALRPEAAARMASLVVDRLLDRDGPFSLPLLHSPGLFRGYAGVAFGLARLAPLDPTGKLSEAAAAAFRIELGNVRGSSAGTVGLREVGGARVFPYLANGSAGLLVAWSELAQVGVAGSIPSDEIERLAESCSGTGYVFDGLFHGAAGVLVGLRSAARQLDGLDDAIARLEASVVARTMRFDGHRYVVGDGLLRLSTDLGTGSAGTMLSLASAPTAWMPIPASPPPGQREEVEHGIDHQDAGQRDAR